jgi:hypothetical protein
MTKFIGVTAWWVILLVTSLGFAALLIKAVATRRLAGNFIALSYCSIALLALLLNRPPAPRQAAEVLRLPSRLLSTATPWVYGVALVQERFRHSARRLLSL